MSTQLAPTPVGLEYVNYLAQRATSILGALNGLDGTIAPKKNEFEQNYEALDGTGVARKWDNGMDSGYEYVDYSKQFEVLNDVFYLPRLPESPKPGEDVSPLRLNEQRARDELENVRRLITEAREANQRILGKGFLGYERPNDSDPQYVEAANAYQALARYIRAHVGLALLAVAHINPEQVVETYFNPSESLIQGALGVGLEIHRPLGP